MQRGCRLALWAGTRTAVAGRSATVTGPSCALLNFKSNRAETRTRPNVFKRRRALCDLAARRRCRRDQRWTARAWLPLAAARPPQLRRLPRCRATCARSAQPPAPLQRRRAPRGAWHPGFAARWRRQCRRCCSPCTAHGRESSLSTSIAAVGEFGGPDRGGHRDGRKAGGARRAPRASQNRPKRRRVALPRAAPFRPLWRRAWPSPSPLAPPPPPACEAAVRRARGAPARRSASARRAAPPPRALPVCAAAAAGRRRGQG